MFTPLYLAAEPGFRHVLGSLGGIVNARSCYPGRMAGKVASQLGENQLSGHASRTLAVHGSRSKNKRGNRYADDTRFLMKAERGSFILV